MPVFMLKNDKLCIRMANHFISDQQFEKHDFDIIPLGKATYENCVFEDCNFASSDLSRISFEDCEFRNCNLSLVKTGETAFKDVCFSDCKMVGVHFEHCNPFLLEFRFENCKLDLSSFYKLKEKKTQFENCSLHDVDFTESDLEASSFINCDLRGSRFERTNIEKSDFRSAVNYSIDPENNKLRKAKFSLPEVSGLLHKYDISIS